jgi:hypothetical protein
MGNSSTVLLFRENNVQFIMPWISEIFWDVTVFRLKDRYKHFRRADCLHFVGRKSLHVVLKPKSRASQSRTMRHSFLTFGIL